MDRARKLAFIKDFGQALIKHLKNESNHKIQKHLMEGFQNLYQTALLTDKTPDLNKGKKEKSDRLHHAPMKIVWYLKKFTENTHIKYSAHIWDGTQGKGYKNYEHFIDRLNEDLKYYEFNEMPKYHRGLYFNLIFPFLFQKKLNKSSSGEDIDFKWGKHKLKIGWQYPPKVLSSNTEDINKKPYDLRVPIELSPNEPIGRKRLVLFQDFIDIFKNEIEFRRNDFYFLIQRISSEFSDYNVEINGINGLSFFTYTSKIEDVLKRIFQNMDTNFPEIKVDGKIEDGGKIIVEILQVNSYCDKPLDDKKINLKEGEFKTIQENLISLCDWSIQSRFRDGKYYEFKYLDVNHPHNFIPICKEIHDNPNGFKYILTFYQYGNEKNTTG